MFSSTLYGVRMGRIAFGATLFAGTAAMYLTAFDGRRSEGPLAGEVVLVTWAAALVIGAVVRGVFGRTTRSAGSLRAPSVVVPAIGVALLLPLTLLLIGLQLFGGRFEDFDEWVPIAAVFVGVPHIVFAALLAIRAADLAAGRPAPSPWAIYGWTLVSSPVPGVMLYFIPSALVAVIGLPIVPLMFWMKPYLERERAREEAELPRAVVVAA